MPPVDSSVHPPDCLICRALIYCGRTAHGAERKSFLRKLLCDGPPAIRPKGKRSDIHLGGHQGRGATHSRTFRRKLFLSPPGFAGGRMVTMPSITRRNRRMPPIYPAGTANPPGRRTSIPGKLLFLPHPPRVRVLLATHTSDKPRRTPVRGRDSGSRSFPGSHPRAGGRGRGP